MPAITTFFASFDALWCTARAVLERIAERFIHQDSLHELDDRQLADIGVSRSEIESIEAEARRPPAEATRVRLAQDVAA